MNNDNTNLKGLNLVHPENRLIFLKLLELRKFYTNKSSNISKAISTAIQSLKCYPLPITSINDLNKIAGIGVRFSKFIQESVNLSDDTGGNIIDYDEYVNYNKCNLDRICNFIRKNYLKRRNYNPTKNSSTWSFLCILGLFSDSEGNETRLSLEDIGNIFVEFRHFFPEARDLRDYVFLRQLSEKGLINYKIIGYEGFEEHFQYKHKHRYTYGLTSTGRRLTNKLMNKLDVPITNVQGILNKLFNINVTSVNSENIVENIVENQCISSRSNNSSMDIERYKFPDENTTNHDNAENPVDSDSQLSDTFNTEFNNIFNSELHKNKSTPEPSNLSAEDNLSKVNISVLSQDQIQSSDTTEPDPLSNLIDVAYRPSSYSNYIMKLNNKAYSTKTFKDNASVNSSNQVEPVPATPKASNTLKETCHTTSSPFNTKSNKSYTNSNNNRTILSYTSAPTNINTNLNNNVHTSVHSAITSNVSVHSTVHSNITNNVSVNSFKSNKTMITEEDVIDIDDSLGDEPAVNSVELNSIELVDNSIVIDDRETDVEDDVTEVCTKSLENRLKLKYGVDVFKNNYDYEIITVVDKREVINKDVVSHINIDIDTSNPNLMNKYYNKLTQYYKESNKKILFKQLPLGDVIWIINIKSLISPRNSRANGSSESSNYYILDWILERKTTLDLNSSIIDGRYEDQKFRLLNLKGFNRIVYLFEDSSVDKITNKFSKMGNKALNYKSIQTAKINTKFISGFNIINTTNISHSASTLLSIHKMIENFMHEKLRNMTILKNINVHRYIRTNYYSLEKFKEENRKKLSYYELFGRQLRCIPKFGEKLTMSILTLWPTPYKFHEAMNTLTLSDINFKLAINKIKMPKEVYTLCKELFTQGSALHSEVYSDSDNEPL
ncbi:ERCC4 domain protein [Theileria parva strain Muguga]|uniref:ERCC4 domain protein n=1 Tax=Theileria parva strain Muguga TaxID=333668 RepID=UPI001C621F5E|nr:ERCC4 domain protein [Theileria parva strain Muguga]EAN31120.2 ERCC4 domain protein [Theileria parva strain Muguga]